MTFWNKSLKRGSSNRYFLLVIMAVTILAVGILSFIFWNQQREEAERKVSIVLVSKRIDEFNDFWSSVLEGMEMAVSEYNVEFTAMGPPAEKDYEKQFEMIEEAIAMNPDVIILVPSDYTITVPYAKKIEAAGIKLILVDSVMEEEMGLCVVSTNNYEGGRKMGAYLKEYADKNSVIGIVSHNSASSTAIEREEGFRAGLGEYEPQIKDVVYCNTDIEVAYEVTLQMLEDYPQMNMIVGLNEDSATGAARAVRDAGRSGTVRLVGFDSPTEQVQLLEAGVFDAIIVQKPLNMGYLGIQAAYQAALGQKIPESIDSGSVLITKDTIYDKENEKLLFPFKQGN